MIPNLEKLERQLQEKVAALAIKLRIPGVAAGIELDGRRSFAFHGVTNIDNPLAIDSRTLFQVGSNTKTFTATAIMRLVEQRRLSLRAPVSRYLPELRLRDKDVQRRVTLLQLLNHTAGWSGDFFADTGQGDDALANYVNLMSTVEQESPLGAWVSYNNASFSTAGRIIEKVTGKVFEDAIQELVIQPLGLEDTVFPPGPILVRRFASGHFVAGDSVEVAQRYLIPRACSAAGTLCSTPADMLDYARFHRGSGTAGRKRLLTRESLEHMKKATAQSPGSALGGAIAISWLLREVDGITLVGHGGGTNGQISLFQTVPSRKFAITVLTNASNGGQLNAEILDWALEKYLGVKSSYPDPVELDQKRLGEYAGTYRTQGTIASIELRDGKLSVKLEQTDAGKDRAMAFTGEQYQKMLPLPFEIEMLPDDGYRLAALPPRPAGNFVRLRGRVVGFGFGGRLAWRQGGLSRDPSARRL